MAIVFFVVLRMFIKFLLKHVRGFFLLKLVFSNNLEKCHKVSHIFLSGIWGQVK